MIYWLLTTEYPPFHGGGISTYAHATALMLKEKGHDVTVIVYDLSIAHDHITVEEGIRVVRFLPRKTGSHKFLGFNAYISYEYACVVKQLIEKEGLPDILESQEYHGIAYYTQQFKLLGYEHYKDLNILITCHAPAFVYLPYNHVPIYRFPEYWTGELEKSSIRAADILIAPSRYIVQEMKPHMTWDGIEEQYIVNPLQIDNSVQSAPDYKHGKIVCFGKLSPLKGSLELLKYFASLWNGGFEHQLHIIGSTEQVFHPEGCTMEDVVVKKYKQFLDSRQLVLKGQLTPAQSQQELLDANVVLVPSLVDNLPYTVLEAMSLGKVVLASKQGGQSEVIQDGQNGFLFDHNLPGDFQRKLQVVLSLPKEEIKSIGNRAIESIKKNFHPEVVYLQKMAAISTYLAKKQSRTLFPFVEPNAKVIGADVQTATDNLLSVVIPYYNMGAYIEECVQSIIAAEYPEKEILIIDDGSTEQASIEKLSYIKSRYPVTIISKHNEGLSLTRNFGAERAKGHYMAFLDADDTVERTYFKKAIEVLKKYENVHFVGCWAQYFGGSTDSWPTFNPEPPYLLLHNMVNSSALVYKKSSFLKAGLNDEAFIYGMEDWDSVISLVTNGFGGVVLPELLWNYRVRKGSMARSFTRVKKLYLHKLIVDKHAVSYQKYGPDVAHLLNNNGSGLDFDNPTFEPPSGTFFPGAGALKERLKERVKQNKALRLIAYKVYKQIKK